MLLAKSSKNATS